MLDLCHLRRKSLWSRLSKQEVKLILALSRTLHVNLRSYNIKIDVCFFHRWCSFNYLNPVVGAVWVSNLSISNIASPVSPASLFTVTKLFYGPYEVLSVCLRQNSFSI